MSEPARRHQTGVRPGSGDGLAILQSDLFVSRVVDNEERQGSLGEKVLDVEVVHRNAEATFDPAADLAAATEGETQWLDRAAKAVEDRLGGVGTAALFEIGKFLIGLYIGKQGLESTYGASASIVVVLIWVYYSAQIVLFGAEFTHVRARQRVAAAGESSVEEGEDDDWRGTARDVSSARRWERG